MRKKECLLLKNLAKFYGVRLQIRNLDKNVSGLYDREKGMILLDKSSGTIQTFFHELGHHYCIVKKLWRSYHLGMRLRKNGTIYCSKRDARAAILTGHRAETWVDKWAKKEMEMWFPDKLYFYSYGTEQSKKWLNAFHLAHFKQFL